MAIILIEACQTNGAQNTIDILAGCTTTGIAAYLCDTLNLNGFSDWYLPSKDELNQMYLNIGHGNALGLGNIGGFFGGYYWSSTEIDYDSAWIQDFSYGNQNGMIKLNNGSSINVRAVRAF